LKLFYHWKL